MARLRIDAAALVVEYDEAVDMPTPFTAEQGQYLRSSTTTQDHGMPLLKQTSRFFGHPPVVHQMIKTLHARIQTEIDRDWRVPTWARKTRRCL